MMGVGSCSVFPDRPCAMPKHRVYRWIALIVGAALLVIVLATAMLTGSTAK